MDGLRAERIGQHLTRPGVVVGMTEGLSAAEPTDVSKWLQEKGVVTERLALIERADLRWGFLTVMPDKSMLADRLRCLAEQINSAELPIKGPFLMRRRDRELKPHLGESLAKIDRTRVQNIMEGRRWLATVIEGKPTPSSPNPQGWRSAASRMSPILALLAPDALDSTALAEQPHGLTTEPT